MIREVLKEGELEKESNVHFLHIANSDKPVQYYSLDVIISVGYRVKLWAVKQNQVKKFFCHHDRFLSHAGVAEFTKIVSK